MTCTRCSQAIVLHSAGVCGSIFRPRWRARRSCRPCRVHGHPPRSWSGAVEHGSAGRSGPGGFGLACIATWTHTGRDADCPPTGPVAHSQRRQSRLSGAPWRPWIAGRSPASGTSNQFIFRRCWAQDPLDRNIRTATATRRCNCQARCTWQRAKTCRSRRPRRPWPDPGAPPGDWPIPGKWGASGDPTRVSSPGAGRVPRRGTSEQSVAPGSRIHAMDRGRAGAVSGIALGSAQTRQGKALDAVLRIRSRGLAGGELDVALKR